MSKFLYDDTDSTLTRQRPLSALVVTDSALFSLRGGVVMLRQRERTTSHDRPSGDSEFFRRRLKRINEATTKGAALK